jgi:hypothetical protein
MDALEGNQRRRINMWLDLASGDEYRRYMFAWVAFNALCYALFGNAASRRRPDLVDDRGLEGLAGEVRAEGRIEVHIDGRVSIRLDRPDRIRIDIRERYTEDLIFSAFASKFQPEYIRWLEVPQFSAELDKLLEAVRRPGGDYVINMLRIDQHSPDRKLADMAGRNIVVAITDRADLSQLVAVLYQVRNNMFHGEKVPGDMHDNRIVSAARPVLEGLVKRAFETIAEPGAAADRALPGA